MTNVALSRNVLYQLTGHIECTIQLSIKTVLVGMIYHLANVSILNHNLMAFQNPLLPRLMSSPGYVTAITDS
jgi:hypothetical protein